MIRNEGSLGLHRLWITPFEPKVLGGLRGLINQFSDSDSTILTPKVLPRRTIESRAPAVTPAESEEVCNPPVIVTIVADPVPVGDNYEIEVPPGTGDTVTFTPSVSGTTPLSYRWIWNGSTVSASPTYTRQLITSDAVGATEDNDWIGGSSLILVVTNDCGADVFVTAVGIQHIFPP